MRIFSDRKKPGELMLRRAVDWLEFASSKLTRNLDLHLSSSFIVPGHALYSISLVRLSLQGCILITPLDPMKLPLLQEFSLREVDVSPKHMGPADDIIGCFLAGCTTLVTVRLVRCYFLRALKISSLPRLQSLTVGLCWNLEMIEIEAPRLEFLMVYPCKAVVLKDVPSLKVVNIGFSCKRPADLIEMYWDLLSTLTCVTELTLRAPPIELPPDGEIMKGNFAKLTFFNLKCLRHIMTFFFELRFAGLLNILYFFDFPALEELFVVNICGNVPNQFECWDNLIQKDSALPNSCSFPSLKRSHHPWIPHSCTFNEDGGVPFEKGSLPQKSFASHAHF